MWSLRYTASDLAVGADVHAGVGGLARGPRRCSTIEPATRSIPSSRAVARAHEIARAVEWLAPAAICSSVPSTLHFSGSTTSSAPRRRVTNEPIGDLEIAIDVFGGVKLNGADAHGLPFLAD